MNPECCKSLSAMNILILSIAGAPNGSLFRERITGEGYRAVFDQEITADQLAATQFRSPRLFLNTGATAATVAYDCDGVQCATDS